MEKAAPTYDKLMKRMTCGFSEIEIAPVNFRFARVLSAHFRTLGRCKRIDRTDAVRNPRAIARWPVEGVNPHTKHIQGMIYVLFEEGDGTSYHIPYPPIGDMIPVFMRMLIAWIPKSTSALTAPTAAFARRPVSSLAATILYFHGIPCSPFPMPPC